MNILLVGIAGVIQGGYRKAFKECFGRHKVGTGRAKSQKFDPKESRPLKILDRYIIVTFLKTFLLALALLLALVVIFDFAEKLDEFFGNQEETPSYYEILTAYYLNFIPYFAGLYAPLFVFISVVFFNSRLAMRSELIAVFSSGVSYYRFLRPFFLTSLILAALLLYLAHFLIPQGNARRVLFEKKYLGGGGMDTRSVHRQIAPGVFVYMDWYSPPNFFGHKFSLEKFSPQGLREKWLAVNITYDTLSGLWTLHDYMLRVFMDSGEVVRTGARLDTLLPFSPDLFEPRNKDIESMPTPALTRFIEQERMSGTPAVMFYEVEWHKRTATPLSTLIFTLLAVPLSSRRVRGGTGLHIGMGLAIAFAYIFFDRIFITYAYSGLLKPFWAVWIPNLSFAVLTLMLNFWFGNKI